MGIFDRISHTILGSARDFKTLETRNAISPATRVAVAIVDSFSVFVKEQTDNLGVRWNETAIHCRSRHSTKE